ncbi:hypothetical protein BGZ52_000528 [Haplosporangium bisporale]|nr:hypothetical protein BGZ52_000528 [Haplosporangium bisporale]
MASIKHTLTCLVHGYSAPQFFSIKVDPKNTVDEIKKLIVSEPRSGMSAQVQFVLYSAMLPLDHPKVLSCHPLKLLSPLLDTSVVLSRNKITPVLHIMVERVQEAQASPVAIPVYEKGVDAEYTEPKEEANAPALEKRGFGCPDSQSCANYCLSIGRNGGYCGGFLWHTCYCNQS